MRPFLLSLALEILELRFQFVSFSIKQQLADITDATNLRRLLRLAVQAETIDPS